MNIALANKQTLWRTVIVDAALIATACLLPTLSHLFALPLYHLNPMLLVLLSGMLLVSDRRNAYLLAVLLPVVSMLAVGMPTPAKALCMVPEFLVVVLASTLMLAKVHTAWGRFGAMTAAILIGKVVYYLLKALVMAPAILVSTPVATQLIVVVAAAGLFVLLKRN